MTTLNTTWTKALETEILTDATKRDASLTEIYQGGAERKRTLTTDGFFRQHGPGGEAPEVIIEDGDEFKI